MLSIQFIISTFKDIKAIQMLYFLLVVSILLVLDLFSTIYLTHIFGEYLILAIICTVSLLGLFITVRRIKNLISTISENCNKGIFPGNNFYIITGIYIAAFFIILPGFITDIFGFISLFSFFALHIGKYISLKTQTDWHTVYEFMKI